MQEDIIRTIENSFLFLPEEVRFFLYKGPFNKAIEDISEEFMLTVEQKTFVNSAVLAHILGSLDDNSIESILQQTQLSQEMVFKIKSRVSEKILRPLLDYVEMAMEEEGERDIGNPINNTRSVSPTQALASIKERLSSPSTVAPITRDHSFSKNESVVEKVVEKPKIDPYRELPSE
jgi:hypothetical protein